eukprot:TRINITY_DN11679_c0_g1_i2.p1 TRINITY_DN11679_c0_g1~~TRINITY_DN11679_c0_g1_i2.p1  ORF type:complete len:191 (-),score=57.27 TRINITY_DN11679_c0_g1_i2:102-674(-)
MLESKDETIRALQYDLSQLESLLLDDDSQRNSIQEKLRVLEEQLGEKDNQYTTLQREKREVEIENERLRRTQDKLIEAKSLLESDMKMLHDIEKRESAILDQKVTSILQENASLKLKLERSLENEHTMAVRLVERERENEYLKGKEESTQALVGHMEEEIRRMEKKLLGRQRAKSTYTSSDVLRTIRDVD